MRPVNGLQTFTPEIQIEQIGRHTTDLQDRKTDAPVHSTEVENNYEQIVMHLNLPCSMFVF